MIQVCWPSQLVIDDLFGAQVGLGDEIGRALAGNLQVFDFVEIARQGLAGLDGGVDHDGEKGGTRHCVLAWLKRLIERRREGSIPARRW
jgi:hypothetical protein